MALSSDPLLIKSSKRSQRPDKQTHLSLRRKTAEQFVKKLNHAKNALRLLTCEFDEQLLQFPGLLGALTPRLEAGWQSSNIQSGAGDVLEWEVGIANQLPALIKPMVPAQSGPSGPVPLSYSFTWTKYQPKIIDEANQETSCHTSKKFNPEATLPPRAKDSNRRHLKILRSNCERPGSSVRIRDPSGHPVSFATSTY
ncbi:hypothetical protein P879_11408 [Paragonimus westermani]|uniref:Uncharacterized protein n=1 Tax=Paragonimus westermani TaxID=34504 RepID=A0A8T0DCH3_9TREM|nr:hypothetical protein P879_11408 [Paragonimus westermani]